LGADDDLFEIVVVEEKDGNAGFRGTDDRAVL
jgi:hypothetical protein